jgi:hypothetical protein
LYHPGAAGHLIQEASWDEVEQSLENDNVGEDCFLVYPKNGNESPENWFFAIFDGSIGHRIFGI